MPPQRLVLWDRGNWSNLTDSSLQLTVQYWTRADESFLAGRLLLLILNCMCLVSNMPSTNPESQVQLLCSMALNEWAKEYSLNPQWECPIWKFHLCSQVPFTSGCVRVLSAMLLRIVVIRETQSGSKGLAVIQSRVEVPLRRESLETQETIHGTGIQCDNALRVYAIDSKTHHSQLLPTVDWTRTLDNTSYLNNVDLLLYSYVWKAQLHATSFCWIDFYWIARIQIQRGVLSGFGQGDWNSA